MNPEIIAILGPTASGKTLFAAALSADMNTEIISADSRQVYRGMDIGTGKDLEDYNYNGRKIPYHLIDIRDAGEKYNLFEYQQDFAAVFSRLKQKEAIPILCGGTGLYIEAVLKAYRLLAVPENPELRKILSSKSLEELELILSSYKVLHNNSDIDSAKRAVRAIEIEEYSAKQDPKVQCFEPLNSLIVGINIEREERRSKISRRLKARLKEGMIEEVEALLKQGIDAQDLIYYGLEYKFITMYVCGEITFQQMFDQLEVAIHQFAKRQMTWFRGMERRGFEIHWVPAEMCIEEKISFVKTKLEKYDT